MATQRIISKEKTYLDVDDKDSSIGGIGGAREPSNISPAVPTSVIWNLLGFTFAMITLPIGTYFFTLRFVFGGNSTYAGGLAALMANVVLVAYVVVAMREDQTERLLEEEKEEERRKKAL